MLQSSAEHFNRLTIDDVGWCKLLQSGTSHAEPIVANRTVSISSLVDVSAQTVVDACWTCR